MGIAKTTRELKEVFREGNSILRMQDFQERSKQATLQSGRSDQYDHAQTVKSYYELCTEIMVFGWGESLHFAPLSPNENLEESKTRHQRLMISKLDLKQDMKVVDIGCGIGGPMRRVVREGNVHVVGININELQLNKAKKLNSEAGLDDRVDYRMCSFMDMNSLEEESFDRGYAIESTCHAPDKLRAFKEIFRILKPGALFWGQEMCLTNRFDPDNPQHQNIKRALMKGIALNEIASFAEVNYALESAGFDVLEGMDRDMQEDSSTPWYYPMANQHGTVGNFLLRIPAGRRAVVAGLKLAETFRLFPKGSADVVRLMNETAFAYVAGGESGIFTPLYCFLARKPQ